MYLSIKEAGSPEKKLIFSQASSEEQLQPSPLDTISLAHLNQSALLKNGEIYYILDVHAWTKTATWTTADTDKAGFLKTGQWDTKVAPLVLNVLSASLNAVI